MLQLLPYIIGMAGLLGLSAFFSGTETALFSLSAGQVHELKSSRHRLAHLIGRLLSDPADLLITLLVSNMVINVLYFTLASLMAIGLGRDHPFWAAAVAVGALVVIVLFGEVGPKMTAYSYPTAVARLAALPLFLVHQALRPIRRVLRTLVVAPLTRLAHPAEQIDRTVSTEELHELLTLSQRRGILHADETVMLQEIIALNQVKVRDVMVPRVQMVAFDADRPIEQLRDLFGATRLTRIPVFRGDLDHLLGWAEARAAFLDGDKPLAQQLRPIHYAADLVTVEQLLLEFRRDKIQTAIVVDEYGGTAGLVSLEDVVEEIVGEIADAQAPLERAPVEQIGPAEYSVSGQLLIRDWADAFGQELAAEGLSTVGGLVFKLLGRVAHVGDRVRYGNVTFVVESMHRRRIDRLRLLLEPPPEGA